MINEIVDISLREFLRKLFIGIPLFFLVGSGSRGIHREEFTIKNLHATHIRWDRVGKKGERQRKRQRQTHSEIIRIEMSEK